MGQRKQLKIEYLSFFFLAYKPFSFACALCYSISSLSPTLFLYLPELQKQNKIVKIKIQHSYLVIEKISTLLLHFSRFGILFAYWKQNKENKMTFYCVFPKQWEICSSSHSFPIIFAKERENYRGGWWPSVKKTHML